MAVVRRAHHWYMQMKTPNGDTQKQFNLEGHISSIQCFFFRTRHDAGLIYLKVWNTMAIQ